MPQPIAYNTGNPISGSIEKSTLSFAVEGGPRDLRDYSSSYAGVNWYSTIPPQDGKYVIISASNPPQIWVTADETNAELLTTVNGLPDRYNQTLFTDTGSALNWLAQNAYFVSRETPDQIDADSMVLNLDAGIESSYPRTGTTWYDLSGNTVNGALNNSPGFNSAGWLELDGVDDNITTNASVNSYSGSIEVIATRENSTQNTFIINSVASGTNRFYIRQNMGISDWDVVRGNPLSAAGLGTITPGRFYHIVMTWNSNTVYGYKNGELMNSAGYGNPGTPTTFIGIGAANSGGVNAINSNVAKVKVYNKTLSLPEVKQNYYGGPIVTDGLVFAVDASNLVSYESGSTTTYSLTGSDSGILQNGVGFGVDNGGTFVFDGVDDKISLTPSSIYNTGALTIEYWAKLNNDGSRHIILANWSGYAVEVSANLYPYITWWNGTSQRNTPQTLTLTAGEWGHVVSTWDGTTFSTYVNGQLSGTNTDTISYGVYVREISSTTFGGGAVNGDIGVFRQYNRALSYEEIIQNYNAQRQKYLS